MKAKLYTHVITSDKVSFIEGAKVGRAEGPVILRISKGTWLELEKPEVVNVEVVPEWT